MKNSKKITMIIVFLVVTVFLSLLIYKNNKSSYSVENTYTREQLQDIVVSTAFKYYYKRKYADYESGTMTYDGVRWRETLVTPEEVSASRYFTTDCSDFAYLVYTNSLGYNMTNENISSSKKAYQVEDSIYNYKNKYFTNFTLNKVTDSAENFLLGANNYGLGWYTNYLFTVAREYWKNKEGNAFAALTAYEENSTNPGSPFVYYYQYIPDEYKTEYDSSSSDLGFVSYIEQEHNWHPDDVNVNEIVANKLKPGDIVVVGRINNNNGKATGGHVMVYVGEEHDLYDGTAYVFGGDASNLVIHSTTKYDNYDFDSVPIDFATEGDSYDAVAAYSETSFKARFSYESKAGFNTYAIAIIRPINSYCTTDDNCVVATLSETAVARNEQFYLSGEQYIDKYVSNYASFNRHDVITYKLVLENTDKRSENNVTYDGLKISASIPENTTYVDESCTNGCTYEDGTITWNDVSISGNDGKITYSFEVEIGDTDSISFGGYSVRTNNGHTLSFGNLTNSVHPTIKTAIDKNLFELELTKFSAKVNENNIVYSELTLNSGSSNNTDYKKDYDAITSSNKATLSSLGFIQSLYYNTLGIDLGFLSNITTIGTGFNCNNSLSDSPDYLIKSALFKYDCDNTMWTYDTSDVGSAAWVYFKKFSQNEIRAYSNRTNNSLKDGIYYRANLSANEQNIAGMLVPGLYGGRALVGNELGNRMQLMRYPVNKLEYGDIIITFNGNNSDEIKSYIYLGKSSGTNGIVASYDYDYFQASDGAITKASDGAILKIYDTSAEYDKNANDGNGKSANRLIKELYASNLFVVLRPTRVLGTTVHLDSTGGTLSNKNFVTGTKYSRVESFEPTKTGYTFTGWYTSETGGDEVTDNTSVPSNVSSVTLYAQWSKNPPTSISVTTLPSKTSYIQGYENLDLTGGKLTLIYDDESTEEIDLTSEGVEVSGFDNTTLGTKEITVSYEGLTTTFEVEVVPPQMESISVTTLPRTQYEVGDHELDLTGGVLTITYNNNTTTTIPLTSEGITVSGFDGSTAGTQMITVEYSELTTTFEVTVNKALLDRPLVSIDIDGVVTWTSVEGASSYEVSFDNITYVAGTSGNVTIPLTTAGEVTVYVKGVPDSNHITSSNAYGSATVDVYSLTITGDEGINTVVGSENYVSGKEVTISATLKNGYNFAGWTVTSGSTPSDVSSLTTTVVLTQNTTLQATTEVTQKESGYITLDQTEGSITYGGTSKTFNITSTHGGEITVTDNNDTVVTSVEGNTVTISNLDTINAETTITVIVTSAETEDYTEASATYTLTVNKAMLGIPEVSIDTDGVVTWTSVEGASSYEVSFDNTTYVAGTSGNIMVPLLLPGEVTVYVKPLADANHVITSNVCASASVNVYSLTITGDEGIYEVTGSGNYVSGKEVTITAALNGGYDFNGWTVTSGNTPSDVNSLTTTVTLTQNTVLKATSVIPIIEPTFNLPNIVMDSNNNVFNNIESKTYLSELFNTTDNNGTVEIYSKWDILLYSKDVTSNIYISTGQYVTYINQSGERVRYNIVVPGDTSGDGKISYLDYVNVYNHIKKTKHPELTNKQLLVDEYLLAADMNPDNKINYLDYVRIYNKIKELKNS